MSRRHKKNSQITSSRSSRADSDPARLAYARGRIDSWQNPTTGMGTWRDKMAGTSFVWGARLGYVELEALYYQDAIAARIIDTKPEHAMRRGYKFELYSDAEMLEQAFVDLAVDDKILDARRWARLYGGAAIIIGADDGLDPQYPLQVDRVRGVQFLNVIDRRFLFPMSYYNDPHQPKYGEPEIYEVSSPLGGNSSHVHESRLLKFYGTSVDQITQRREAGWSYSLLQRVYDVLQKFATGVSSAAQLISDAGQGVFSIQGLLAAIANDEEDTMVSRMAAVDMARSTGRSLLLDSEGESFERQPVQVSGVSDILDRLMMLVSATAEGMPVTLLFGRSAAGLNSTGDNEIAQWNESVSTDQYKVVRPAILRMAAILSAGAFNGKLVFCPLTDRDPKADADVAKVHADTDKIYIDAGVLHPEQVAMFRFADEPIEIDVAKYKQSLKAEIDLAVSTAGQPPPDPPAAPGMPPPAMMSAAPDQIKA